MNELKDFKPTHLVLVPLFVETIHKRIWKEIEKKGMKKKVLFAIKLSNALRKVGIDLRNKIFKDVKAALGGNIEKIVCGGAPLSKNLISDFDAFGITIYEGYGITECSPLVSVNRPGDIKLGSVGPAVPGTTVRFFTWNFR
jgi:long-chain acyl-CoA synthetase